VSGGETCDVAIKSGPGKCPTECSTTNACEEPILEGSGCQAHCVVKTIGLPKNGDGCCPKGLTHAQDSDCPASYGEMCKNATECASGLCLTNVMCTKTCTLTGNVNQCGVPGHFCFEHSGGTNICYPLVATGADPDDRYIGPGVPYMARMDSANDADAFVADLQIGIYTVTITPTDTPSQVDLVLDVYDGSATKVGTINSTGVGGTEIVDYTVGAAGRQVFVVKSANALQGWYTIKIEKKS
jgi:hypothetical protein